MCNEDSKKPINYNLKIKEFDIKKLRDGCVIVIIDQEKTDKSLLTKNILYNKKSIQNGVVISDNESNAKSFSETIPYVSIHKEYTSEIIGNVIEQQISVLKKVHDNNQIDPRSFLILDDCLDNSEWQEDKNIRLCFIAGRNIRLSLILTMQYPIVIRPHIRTNIDFIFIYHCNIKCNQRRLYDYYGKMFPTFQLFSETLNEFTRNHYCLVIDNNARRNNHIEDIVFWYKADKITDFKMEDIHYHNFNKRFTIIESNIVESNMTTSKL
jgi:hypothetical protein